jgi:hypothetical protein
MATVEDTSSIIVSVNPDKAYLPASNHGEVQVSTTAASTIFQRTAATNMNASNVRFDVPLNKQLALSKNIKMHFPCRFRCSLVSGRTFTAGADSDEIKSVLGDMGSVSFAPGGILNIINNMQIAFGSGSSYNIQDPAVQLRNILAFTKKYDIDESLSGCMLKPDMLSNYQLMSTADDLTVPDLKNNTSFLRRNSSQVVNPFSGVGESDVWSDRMPAYRVERINDNTTTDFYLYVDLESFIPSSLFNTMDRTKSNFFGVEKLSVILTLQTTYGKLFSMKVDQTEANNRLFVANTLEFTEAPIISTTHITPPEIIRNELLDEHGFVKPYMIGYSYYDVLDYTIPGTVPATDAGRKSKVSYNTMSCQTLPKRMFISVIPNPDLPLTAAEYGTTSTPREVFVSANPRNFARIDGCVLTINGTRSLVSANADDLYRISVENGLSYKRHEALFTTGAPVIIDLRKDASLNGMLIGHSDPVTIGVDIDFTNLDMTYAHDFKLVVMVEYEAILKHERGAFQFLHTNVSSSISGLTLNDLKSMPPDFYRNNGIYLGGSILGTVKDGFNWVVNHAPQIGSAIKTGVDVVRTLRGGKNEIIGGSPLTDTRFR